MSMSILPATSRATMGRQISSPARSSSILIGLNGISIPMQPASPRRASIERTYATTSIRADGQVILVPFNDGIIFEIVPAFINVSKSYTYPDATIRPGFPHRPSLDFPSVWMAIRSVRKSPDSRHPRRRALSWSGPSGIPSCSASTVASAGSSLVRLSVKSGHFVCSGQSGCHSILRLLPRRQPSTGCVLWSAAGQDVCPYVSARRAAAAPHR